MKILVTGASGFIGSSLIPALLSENHKVFTLVRSVKKIKSFDWYPKVKTINKDLKSLTKDDIEDINPDIIYHLAWSDLPNYEDPIHIEKNLPEQLFFLRLVAECNVKKIIITGSCLEYGLQNGLLNEENTLQPSTFYGLAKASVLSMANHLKNKFGFDFVWYRIFYVYGENQNQSSLYPSLINAIKNEESVFKMSHGNQMRDFIHIDDVIKYLLIPLHDYTISGIYNISNGKGIKVKDFVERIVHLHGSQIKINFGHYAIPNYEPNNFWGDNSKIKKVKNKNLKIKD